MAAGDGASERASLADQVILAHELVQRPRSHPGGQRLARRGRPEERLWGARGASTWRHRVRWYPGVGRGRGADARRG